MIQGMTNSTMSLENAEAARGNPRGISGMSGLGQIIPGIPKETQKTVIYGAVAIVGLSLLLFLALRPRRQGGLQNAK